MPYVSRNFPLGETFRDEQLSVDPRANGANEGAWNHRLVYLHDTEY